MRKGNLSYRTRLADYFDVEPSSIVLLKNQYFLLRREYNDGFVNWSLHEDKRGFERIGTFPTKRMAKLAASDPKALDYYQTELVPTLHSYGTLRELGVSQQDSLDLIKETNPTPYSDPWLKRLPR